MQCKVNDWCGLFAFKTHENQWFGDKIEVDSLSASRFNE